MRKKEPNLSLSRYSGNIPTGIRNLEPSTETLGPRTVISTQTEVLDILPVCPYRSHTVLITKLEHLLDVSMHSNIIITTIIGGSTQSAMERSMKQRETFETCGHTQQAPRYIMISARIYASTKRITKDKACSIIHCK